MFVCVGLKLEIYVIIGLNLYRPIPAQAFLFCEGSYGKNLFKNAREELDSWFGGPEQKISRPRNQKLTACMLSQWAQTNLSNRGLIVLFIILWSTLAPIWVFLMCLGFFAVMHVFFFFFCFCYLFVRSPFLPRRAGTSPNDPLRFQKHASEVYGWKC